jgi:hypothetical protein
MTPPVHRFAGIDPARVAADQHFQAPDLIEAVEGWRTWEVDPDLPEFGVAPKLRSVTHREYTWIPRQEARAVCAREPDCDHQVDSDGQPIGIPGENCMCGFYAAKTLEHLQGMGYIGRVSRTGQVPVVGQLALWGKVIEGSQGWRAEKAYPVTLFVPFEHHRLARPLAKAFGVPVRLLNVFPKPDDSEEE